MLLGWTLAIGGTKCYRVELDLVPDIWEWQIMPIGQKIGISV